MINILFACLKKILLIFFIFPFLIFTQNLQLEKNDLEIIRNIFNDQLYAIAIEEIVIFEKQYPQSTHSAEINYYKVFSLYQSEKKEEAIALAKIELNNFEKAQKRSVLEIFTDYYFKKKNYLQSQHYINLLLQHPLSSKHKIELTYLQVQIFFALEEWKQTLLTSEKIFDEEQLNEQQKNSLQYYIAWSSLKLQKTFTAFTNFQALQENQYLTDEQNAQVHLQLAEYFLKEDSKREAQKKFDIIKEKYSHTQTYRLAQLRKVDTLYAELKKKDKYPADQVKELIGIHQKNIESEEPINISHSIYMQALLYELLHDEKNMLNKTFALLDQSADISQYKDLIFKIVNHSTEKKDASHAKLILKKFVEAVKDIKLLHQIKYALGEIYLKKNQCNKALQYFSAVDGNSLIVPEVLHYYNFQCYFKTNQTNKAFKEFKKIPKGTDMWQNSILNYLEILKKKKHFKSTLTFIDKYYKKQTYINKVIFLQYKINALYRLKRIKKLIATINLLFKINTTSKKDYNYYIMLAESHDQLKQFKKSEKYYWQAFKRTPTNLSSIKTKIGDILIDRYSKEKDYRKLVDVYATNLRYIKSAQQKRQIILLTANIYSYELKNDTLALKWYNKLYNKGKRKENFEAAFEISNILIKQKKMKRALQVLQKIRGGISIKSPWYVPVHFKIAQIYQFQDQLKQALKYYKQVVIVKNKSEEKSEALKQITAIQQYLVSQ